MSENSKIQWTSATWNPWHGCRKVSDGCKYCYMFRDKSRYGQDPTKVVRSKTTFNQPLKMKEPGLIFTCSWSDWFIEDADAWRGEAWKIIKDTPEHTYQILTKRPQNILDRLPQDWGDGYKNVWLGVSVENRQNAGRIALLQRIKAKTKFVSFEPLINFVGEVDLCGIHWAIIGGESGNNNGYYTFRKCETQWIRALVEECRSQNVAIFVKQLGTYLSQRYELKDTHGGDISEFPEDLQIREFPKGWFPKRKGDE